jgi:lipopolysaccharide transport system ATP-binding protein
MSMLRVEQLGKAFRSYDSEWQRIRSWFSSRARPAHEHWVLRDISFDLPAGQAVGIVGRNGAGKSTLLKLITGTLAPSEGAIQVNGRIGSILELGIGFNPMLTGRQNALHSLSLMGFDAAEVATAIGRVEEFAEVGEYFDQPVRVYSSGMQMRVAFAVVTAFRPDILIVDEALSVGDAYFQHKSFNRIREFREQGTSLLIVSHDRAAIMALCDRAIVLHEGAVVKDAEPAEAIDYYNAIIGNQGAETVRVAHDAEGRVQVLSGSGEATVECIELRNTKGEAVEIIDVGDRLTLHIEVRCLAPVERLVLGFLLRDRLGQSVYGTNTHHLQRVLHAVAAGEHIIFDFDFLARLGPGSYSVPTALTSSQDHHERNFEWRELALVFEVVNRSKAQFAGSNWLDPGLSVVRHEGCDKNSRSSWGREPADA